MKTWMWLAAAVSAVVSLTTGCSCNYAGADGGSVGVVRNGGPFDKKNIKEVICPAAKSHDIGYRSSVHYYPTSGVQRYFTITTDRKAGADYQGVVQTKTADGFNVHLQGTLYFETKFGCAGDEKTTTEAFDNQFGVRKFPDPGGGGQKAPWEGDAGWSAFLNAIMLPIIQNEFRVAMLTYNCEQLVSSCALVANRNAEGIDKETAAQTGVNLQAIQDKIQTGLESELLDTLGRQYFQKIVFRMAQPELDPLIERKINESLGAFAAVSKARAEVQRATQQRLAQEKLAQLYTNNPALVELEKWRIICGGAAGQNNTAPTGGCGGAQIVITSGAANVLLGKGK